MKKRLSKPKDLFERTCKYLLGIQSSSALKIVPSFCNLNWIRAFELMQHFPEIDSEMKKINKEFGPTHIRFEKYLTLAYSCDAESYRNEYIDQIQDLGNQFCKFFLKK